MSEYSKVSNKTIFFPETESRSFATEATQARETELPSSPEILQLRYDRLGKSLWLALGLGALLLAWTATSLVIGPQGQKGVAEETSPVEPEESQNQENASYSTPALQPEEGMADPAKDEPSGNKDSGSQATSSTTSSASPAQQKQTKRVVPQNNKLKENPAELNQQPSGREAGQEVPSTTEPDQKQLLQEPAQDIPGSLNNDPKQKAEQPENESGNIAPQQQQQQPLKRY